MPFHNGCDAPSKNKYCKRGVVEVILVETPGGMKDEYLFRVPLSYKPLPGGSKVRGNVRSSSVQESYSPECKSIADLMDESVGNSRTQRTLTSCFKVNERIKGLRPFTILCVLYRIAAIILP